MAELTFRGKKYPKPIRMCSTTYKTDYRLVPKHEEEAFLNSKVNGTPSTRIMPRFMEFPPLMQLYLLREKKFKGLSSVDTKMEIIYSKSPRNNYRIAEEGETATIELTCDLGKPVSPRLYEGIKITCNN